MLGIYLSGTGNTRHCMEMLVSLIDKSAECVPLEDKDITEKIKKNDVIYLGYPTQFSNMPYMVRDFIQSNQTLWSRKKVFCVATMGAFSGDATGYYEKWQRHMLERLGESGVSEYNGFVEKYAKYWKFRIETEYIADRKIKYIDDRLVLQTWLTRSYGSGN